MCFAIQIIIHSGLLNLKFLRSCVCELLIILIEFRRHPTHYVSWRLTSKQKVFFHRVRNELTYYLILFTILWCNEKISQRFHSMNLWSKGLCCFRDQSVSVESQIFHVMLKLQGREGSETTFTDKDDENMCFGMIEKRGRSSSLKNCHKLQR